MAASTGPDPVMDPMEIAWKQGHFTRMVVCNQAGNIPGIQGGAGA